MSASFKPASLYAVDAAYVNTVDTKNCSYVRIPTRIVVDSRLSDAQYRLLSYLQTHTRPGQPIAFPCQVTIAAALHWSLDKVQRALSALIKLGLVLSPPQQRDARGEWGHKRYDLSPVHAMLPERVTGTAKSPTGEHSAGRAPLSNPARPVPQNGGTKNNCEAVIYEEQNKAATARDPKPSVVVPVDIKPIEKETAETIKKRVPGLAWEIIVGLVKRYGVDACRKHLAKMPPADKITRSAAGWFIRALDGYQYDEAQPVEKAKRVKVRIPEDAPASHHTPRTAPEAATGDTCAGRAAMRAFFQGKPKFGEGAAASA